MPPLRPAEAGQRAGACQQVLVLGMKIMPAP